MAADAKSAWGIEIGQAGLKAVRLRVGDDGESVRATAFDYIPHPKILSQPDAVPAELIELSVATFLERNNLGDDLVGISVPGHTSLAKFIKLPPVEPGKVAEIVQYEARQQIPFDLDEVVWDFQPIGGGVEESGFMLEAEVGLFAMKRELIFESMRPLMEKGEEVEVVQIAPLALYNYLSYDVLAFRQSEETPEPPDAEDYYIVLDMGADNTTLLVSNGRSIWIRNVPIGGNHFTRALTREMKLTFAKAEHLKCNATKSPDPKAVFQAMRPVFNDYVTEIQRSIGYFGSVNRAAKIKKVIGVGNGFKLAGLQKFLQQNLQYEVERLEHLDGVTGDSVLGDPLFMDNVMTFAVPYGLALQTLKQTRIHTSLLPPEIVTERKVRSKKPWIVAAVAGLLLALGLSTAATARVGRSVGPDRFKAAYANVDKLKSFVSTSNASYAAEKATHETMVKEIDKIAAPLRRRTLWMEVLKAVNECLPREEGEANADLSLQKKIRIESLYSQKVEDVGTWHAAIVASKKKEEFASPSDRDIAPSGAGYIFTLKGYHLYNHKSIDFRDAGVEFVNDTLAKNLKQWTIERDGILIPVGQLGISHPVVLYDLDDTILWDPDERGGAASDARPMNRPGGPTAGRTRKGRGGGFGGGGSRGYQSRSEDEDEDGGGYGRNRRGPSGLTNRLPGSNPIDDVEANTAEPQEFEKTVFTLQFAWIPILEGDDRSDERPVPTATPAAAPVKSKW